MRTESADAYLESTIYDLTNNYNLSAEDDDERLQCVASAEEFMARTREGILLTGTMAWIRGERDRLRDLHMEAGHRQEP